MQLNTGVYCFRNISNGLLYIGSTTVSFNLRKNNHVNHLNKGTHDNRHLQSAWKKYGKSNFEFSILERCLPEDCIVREQYWIDKLEVAIRGKGYNLCSKAGKPGSRKKTKAERLAISKRLKGVPKTLIHRKRMSQSRLGMKWTDSIRKKILKTRKKYPGGWGKWADNKGEKNPRAKLNETKVLQILRSKKDRRELAVKYNVSLALINAIKTRRVWSHINFTSGIS